MTKDITDEILAAASNEVLADPFVQREDHAAVASFVAGLWVGTLTKLMAEKRARIMGDSDALGIV